LTAASSSSKEELSSYLPSAALQDLGVQNRVKEIVAHVLSQPQLLKDRAANVADEIVDRFDVNKDGKVSVSDIAGSVYDISTGVATYCSTFLSTVLPDGTDLPSMLNSIFNSKFEPYWSEIQGKVAGMEQYYDLFEPLWAAATVMKLFVSRYAGNVKERVSPLTPYLTSLISETSVTELPFELISLTSATAGFKKDEGYVKVAEETRALFWALVDISFILEALKETKTTPEQNHALEGVQIVNDADALKDGSWAQGFNQLDFS